MEALIGQPYLDVKDDLDNFLEAISHAVGEETIDHIEPEVGGYTPAVSGDWAGDPSGTADALDRIAAALAILLGNPIP